MKLITVLLTIVIAAAASCNPVSDASQMQQISDMKDSIFKAYPNVGAVRINILNREDLIVTLGSKKLAKADAPKRDAIAADIGGMALRIIGSNAGLKTEKLIITPNERNDVAEPADGIVTNLSLESLAQHR